MIKVKNKYTGEIVYFRFLASEKYPGAFWHTKTIEPIEFELSNIKDYEPIGKTWEEIKNEKI